MNAAREQRWPMLQFAAPKNSVITPPSACSLTRLLSVTSIDLGGQRLDSNALFPDCIADLDRYRKNRLERQKEMGLDQADTYRRGILWGASKQDRSYFVLPQVLRLDGVWRNIPREVFGDFPQPPAFADQTAPPIIPEPNGHPLPGAQSAARATGIPGQHRMEDMDAPFASGPVELR